VCGVRVVSELERLAAVPCRCGMQGPPPFPPPPIWWQPGESSGRGCKGGGGKGGGGKGGGSNKGFGGGKGGGRGYRNGGGGSRNHHGSGTSSGRDIAAEVFYSPSMVENPWRTLLPDEPPVFPFATMAAAPQHCSAPMDFDRTLPPVMLPSPPPEQLPSPSQQLLMPSEHECARLISTAAELHELLRVVDDPTCARRLLPVVLQSLSRVRSIVEESYPVAHSSQEAQEPDESEHDEHEATEKRVEEPQPPKRCRLTLPPPMLDLPTGVQL
jgi:hypothetical protein